MLRSSLLFIPLLAIVGCGKDGGGKDTGGGENGGGDTCTTQVTSSNPTDGAQDFAFNDTIDFILSAPDSTATITTDIPGSQSVSSDGLTVSWVPSPALDAKTSYSATLDWCGGSKTISFMTSDLGGSVDESVLTGKAYNLALAEADIVEPAGVGSLLSSYLTTPIYIGVTSVGSGKIQMIGAIGVEGATTPAQDYCTQSIDFPEADFTNPSFSVGPEDSTFAIAGFEITIQDLSITGVFAPDGSYFGAGTLAGSIDARDIAEAFPDLGYTADQLCELLVNFNAACETCTDGSNYCLSLVAENITAEELSGMTLVEVQGNDCEGCESGPPAEDAVCE